MLLVSPTFAMSRGAQDRSDADGSIAELDGRVSLWLPPRGWSICPVAFK
jgi:hypothetical protein